MQIVRSIATRGTSLRTDLTRDGFNYLSHIDIAVRALHGMH